VTVVGIVGEDLVKSSKGLQEGKGVQGSLRGKEFFIEHKGQRGRKAEKKKGGEGKGYGTQQRKEDGGEEEIVVLLKTY